MFGIPAKVLETQFETIVALWILNFDFDAFNHEYPEGEGGEYVSEVATEVAAPVVEIAEPTIEVAAPAPAETEVNNSDANNLSSEEVDKW